MTDGSFHARRFTSQDGLGIHFRDYGDPLSPATPVLCLSGLTRNSIDFHELAGRLAPERRVLAMDYRGRGRSDYDPDPMNYQAATYLTDIAHLLAVTGCHKVIVIGTSLGGLLAMAMAALRPATLKGVVLNDIGPELDSRGLNRIRGYVGKATTFPNVQAAATQTQELFGAAFPDFGPEDWEAYAERQFKQAADGSLSLDYDPRLSEALAAQAKQAIDLWPLYRALRDIPVLALRGSLSDILSEATFARMMQEKPDLRAVTVANRGHVPTLGEPVSVEAIDQFLAECDGDARA